MIVHTHRYKQTLLKNRIEHAGRKSKSGLPVKLYFTYDTLFHLFIQKTCQNIARRIEISSILLVYLKHGLAIPWATEKLLQSPK